jgi:hypothetical protein
MPCFKSCARSSPGPRSSGVHAPGLWTKGSSIANVICPSIILFVRIVDGPFEFARRHFRTNFSAKLKLRTNWIWTGKRIEPERTQGQGPASQGPPVRGPWNTLDQRVQTHACTYPQEYTYEYLYIHTYIYIHIYTYMHVCIYSYRYIVAHIYIYWWAQEWQCDTRTPALFRTLRVTRIV